MAPSTNDKLDVDEEEKTIDHDHEASCEWDPSFSEGEDPHGYESEQHLDHEDEQEAEADPGATNSCEVELSGDGKDGEGNGEDNCHESSAEDSAWIFVLGADVGQDVRPAASEDSQHDVVHGNSPGARLDADDAAVEDQVQRQMSRL